ncbi:MAG: hypothetical protein ABI690_35030 [Chloroflexota bacterium]
METGKAGSIFILNPKNRDFKTTRILFDDRLPPLLLMAICWIFVSGFMILMAISDPANSRLRQGFYVGPLPLLGGILMLILYFQKKREIRLLSQNGNVVLGRIAKSRIGNGKMAGFFTHIEYYVTLPSGKVITGKQYQSRSDIKADADLPPPGTPIAVIYANDKVYRIL